MISILDEELACTQQLWQKITTTKQKKLQCIVDHGRINNTQHDHDENDQNPRDSNPSTEDANFLCSCNSVSTASSQSSNLGSQRMSNQSLQPLHSMGHSALPSHVREHGIQGSNDGYNDGWQPLIDSSGHVNCTGKEYPSQHSSNDDNADDEEDPDASSAHEDKEDELNLFDNDFGQNNQSQRRSHTKAFGVKDDQDQLEEDDIENQEGQCSIPHKSSIFLTLLHNLNNNSTTTQHMIQRLSRSMAMTQNNLVVIFNLRIAIQVLEMGKKAPYLCQASNGRLNRHETTHIFISIPAKRRHVLGPQPFNTKLTYALVCHLVQQLMKQIRQNRHGMIPAEP